MNMKKIIITSLVIWAALFVMDLIIHTVLLSGAYAETSHLWRPEAEMWGKMWIMYLGSLALSFFFVFIFAKGYENKGIGEGLRFGVYAFLLVMLPTLLGQYASQPIPFSLISSWLLTGFIEFLVIGVLAAVLYKPATE